MQSVRAIIALLVTAQSKLKSHGLSEDAADLDSHIAAALDEDLTTPSTFLVPTGDEATASVVTAEFIGEETSVAVRTAKRPLSKSEWRQIRRRIKMHPPRRKRWKCCDKPEKRRTRKGKQVWGAVCRYEVKSGPQKGAMMGSWITLSRDPGKKPHEVKMNGRRMKWCRRS